MECFPVYTYAAQEGETAASESAFEAELEQQLAALHPIFIDAVPLSLEEIFIYELGGEDYAIRDIVL